MTEDDFHSTYETLLLLACDAGHPYRCGPEREHNEMILDLAIPSAVKALENGREDLARRVCDVADMFEMLSHLYEYHRYDNADGDLPAFRLLISIATAPECETFASSLRADIQAQNAFYYAQEWLDVADARLEKMMLERLPEAPATKGGKRL